MQESELSEAIHNELQLVVARVIGGDYFGRTLQRTSVVHDAWLRLAPKIAAHAISPTNVKALAARVLRGVVVDHLRAQGAPTSGAS